MLQSVIPLILFLIPLAYSPGPGNMFFAANGAKFGFWSTLPSNVGYHIATWTVTVLIGLGFSAALINNPNVFYALKIAGSLYVIRIAWKLFNSEALNGGEAAESATFYDGIVLLVLNPKAYIIITLMFSQFLEHSDEENIIAVVLITTVFTLNNFIAFVIWTVVGDKVASAFRTENGAKTLNRTFGILLATVAIWMFLS